MNPKTFTRIAGMFCLLGLLGPGACTSSNLCNAENPCPHEWQCLDDFGQETSEEGTCGVAYATPLCGGAYCTTTCQRGSDPDSTSGTCPEPFSDCRQGGASVNEQMVCTANGIQPGMTACSLATASSDCGNAGIIMWME